MTAHAPSPQQRETTMPDHAAPPRSKFEEITERFADIPFMREKQAGILRDIIRDNDATDILEIGFYHGKSSAYIGAILEDLGRGTLVTIDKRSALGRDPSIHDLLRMAGLAHRVQPCFAFRSFTWELQTLITQIPRPRFDLCYFDGGHTWDNTGFGVVLVDMLLKPGGVLVLDDMNWSMTNSHHYRKNPKQRAKFSDDEVATPAVRRTWELILPHLGYIELREIPEVKWGFARKPKGPSASGART
jgi:predicted O-methyltransferase YrrM